MCGILGQISNKYIDKNQFKETLNLIDHRGPDDNGVYFDNNVALGHTRLSILDLSSHGHQPMLSENEEYILIYNGEVYNFEEIKDDHEKKGNRFNKQ